MLKKRLDLYFAEAQKHIELMEDAINVINLPIKNYEDLPNLEKFAINALVFRFSKLQDLIGSKVFRTFLEFNKFDTQDKSFLELLKEIEKEGIIDIDSWDEFRKLRNSIAHEYPGEEDETVEALELLIKKTPLLIEVTSELRDRYHEISSL
jgi:hypothetical protein